MNDPLNINTHAREMMMGQIMILAGARNPQARRQLEALTTEQLSAMWELFLESGVHHEIDLHTVSTGASKRTREGARAPHHTSELAGENMADADVFTLNGAASPSAPSLFLTANQR